MNDCPIDGNFQTSGIIYKYISSATINPDKVYLETGEKNFKKWYYMGTKEQIQRNVFFKVKSVPGYLNVNKTCLLCLHEKKWNHQLPYQEKLLPY